VLFRSPGHIQGLIDNAEEVRLLTRLHVALTGSERGRRRGVEILNKSALVLLVACWESFVEDTATLAFRFMLDEAQSPDAFPSPVLALAAKPLREHKDHRKVWELAGDGWRIVLKKHEAAVLREVAGKLNTPRPRQVDDLMERLLGLKKLSREWKWRGMSADRAATRLDEAVTTRGEIAHRVKAGEYVRKDYVESTATFIQQLAAISSNRVAQHVEARMGKAPWPRMSYRGIH